MLIKTHRDGFVHPIASEITPQRSTRAGATCSSCMATGVAGAALASWAAREALAQQVQRPGKLAALAGSASPTCPAR